MADTPHFLDSIDVDPAEPHSNDPWRIEPGSRYARFDADDTALRTDAATDLAVDEARSEANLAKAYRDTAASSADRADIDADSAAVSAVRAELAAAGADLSAEIASSAAQSAALERHLAFRLPAFVLGVIVGLMLAAVILVGVAIARGATPLAPGLAPHRDCTSAYTSGLSPHLDN